MRVISVLVPPVLIGDGQVPLPAIGETVRYYLRFTEVPRESGDPLASMFTARADPVGDGSPRCGMRFDGTPHDRPPYFPTRLHTDGWGAFWAAPRNVAGQLEVHGSLLAEFGALALPDMAVRGRIARLQTVHSVIDTSDPDQQNWRSIPDRRILTAVQAIPVRSAENRGKPEPEAPFHDTSGGRWEPYIAKGEPQTEYSGVLVDVDIDDLA